MYESCIWYYLYMWGSDEQMSELSELNDRRSWEATLPDFKSINYSNNCQKSYIFENKQISLYHVWLIIIMYVIFGSIGFALHEWLTHNWNTIQVVFLSICIKCI